LLRRRIGKEGKTMTPLRTTALLAISTVTLLALADHARAKTPDELPPTPDIRCLIVGVTLSNTADSTQQISQAMLALFYFGRLDRFSPKDIGDAIAKEAITWKPADSQSEAERCGKELIDKAQIMNEAGKNLIGRGMGLDKEGASPTEAAPATLPPAPALPPIATTSPVSITAPMQDPNHPLHLGQEYYPIESRRHQEGGTCVVRLLVDVNGYIRATQLLSSTGFERLNAACLSSFTDGRMIPATQEGKPITSWYNLRVNWRLNGNGISTTPQIRDDDALKAGLDNYPPLSRKLHQEGDCVVRVTVASDGTPSTVNVTKSTGYAPLDQACLSAIQQAHFVPARQEGKTFAASTDINITWRLP
jgi:TonB family protein